MIYDLRGRILTILLALILGSHATDIRVRNDSKVDFKNVVVGNKKYGDIKRGEATDYQYWDQAYPYAYVSLTAASKQQIIQPRDFVGEKLLGKGKFTYVLTLWRGSLQISAEKDHK
jgi:hypothetical protein